MRKLRGQIEVDDTYVGGHQKVRRGCGAVAGRPLKVARANVGPRRGGRAAMGQMGWSDEKVVERAEFVGRAVKELCQLLRAGGEYPEVSEQIARARGALESIRMVVWQQELARTVSAPPTRTRPEVGDRSVRSAR